MKLKSVLRSLGWKDLACLLVSLFLAFQFTIRLWSLPPTDFDDAYMFMRYAKNILAGEGFVWNAGEQPVFGPTSLLYTFWVAFVHIFIEKSSTCLRLASSIPVYMLVFIFAVMIRRAGRFSKSFSLMLPSLYVFVFDPYYLIHASNGMDTTLAQLGSATLILVTFADRLRIGLVILVAYLTFLARPDLGLYITLFPCLCVWSQFGFKESMKLTAGIVAALATDTLLKWIWLGDVLPLSFFAKRRGYYEGFLGMLNWDTTHYLFEFLLHAAPFVLLAIMFLPRHKIKLAMALVVPLCCTLAYHLQVVAIMGDHARYLWPQLPFAIALGLLSYGQVQWREIRRSLPLRLLGVLVYIGLTLLVLVRGPRFYRQVIVGPMNHYSPKTRFDMSDQQKIQPAGWLVVLKAMTDWTAEMPPGTVIAATEYGMLAAKSPDLVIIDMAGLHNRYLAHHGFDSDYVLDKCQPSLIWMPRPNYTFMWTKILDHPSFVRDYDFYPGLLDYGIAIRRESPQAGQLTNDLTQLAMRFHAINQLNKATIKQNRKDN